MRKLKQDSNGFSGVETILVLVIVALVGIVGWMVYKNQHKDTVAVVSGSSATKDIKKSVDPYAGWKSFCSDAGGLCLKYPTNWTLAQDPMGNASGDAELTTITSPDGKLAVSYTPDYGIGGVPIDQSLNVKDVVPAPASDYVAVKLVYSPAKYSPEVFITPKSQTESDTFTKGAAVEVTGGSNVGHSFNNPKKPNKVGSQILRLTNASDPLYLPSFSTLEEAQAWLALPEVSIGTQILASVYNQ